MREEREREREKAPDSFDSPESIRERDIRFSLPVKGTLCTDDSDPNLRRG